MAIRLPGQRVQRNRLRRGRAPFVSIIGPVPQDRAGIKSLHRTPTSTDKGFIMPSLTRTAGDVFDQIASLGLRERQRLFEMLYAEPTLFNAMGHVLIPLELAVKIV